jgi:hypothetical protein
MNTALSATLKLCTLLKTLHQTAAQCNYHGSTTVHSYPHNARAITRQHDQITTKKETEDTFLFASQLKKKWKLKQRFRFYFLGAPSLTGGWINSPGSSAYIPLLALLEPPQRLLSALSNSTVSILHTTNPSNALCMLTPLIHTVTFIHVSALKGPSSGGTDPYCEHSQQNTCQTAGSMQHAVL